ncbi:hypothetical protein CP10881SC42_0520 [Chlamydia avium]|uniref:Outer membrane protein n=1 Tax=Chlamydia avium TaxID=1457141 RepID=A0ABP2X8I8_9CHLA|nr:hypothetical protein CP10743SC13_0432 [Chlamydia psittaci 10_743_SC13]EPP38369.1 hypothetical protein CP10881SC42_0520 [Chlamydia avium]
MFFHLLTLAGQLISTPIYIIHDACGIDKEAYEAPQPRPFSLQMQYLQIENADFKKLPHQSLGLCQSDASLLFTLPLTPQFGLLLSTGYVGVDIHWDHTQPSEEDPKSLLGYATFQDKSYYNYLMFSLGAYTVSLTNWQWSVVFSSFLDPENLEIGYGLYQAVLSGKYQATPQLSAIFGVINETGLHQEKAWPLLGASYKLNDQLTINCIYPLNFSLEYKCTSVCNFGTAYRLTRFRKKLPKNNLSSSEGIFEYQGREIEGNIKLTPWPGSFIKAFYGWSLGKDISLADSHNNQSTSYPFKTSIFFGGSAVVTF